MSLPSPHRAHDTYVGDVTVNTNLLAFVTSDLKFRTNLDTKQSLNILGSLCYPPNRGYYNKMLWLPVLLVTGTGCKVLWLLIPLIDSSAAFCPGMFFPACDLPPLIRGPFRMEAEQGIHAFCATSWNFPLTAPSLL